LAPPEAGAVGARGDANTAPHWVQKRLPSVTFPQFGQTIHAPFFGKSAATKMVLVQFFKRRQTEPISTSPYAIRTASHTCRIMDPGPVISDVSNCPFLILFANSIPLNVTCAFPNVLGF
jgi:hypothetical protein